jgi:hypothetical protein
MTHAGPNQAAHHEQAPHSSSRGKAALRCGNAHIGASLWDAYAEHPSPRLARRRCGSGRVIQPFFAARVPGMTIEHRVRVFDISKPRRMVKLEQSLDKATAEGWEIVPIGYSGAYAAFIFRRDSRS